MFERWLLDRVPEPDDEALLVNRIVSEVEGDRDLLRVEQLADRCGIGIRRLQRLVGSHIGFSPKWLIQRYRLQEAAAALRSEIRLRSPTSPRPSDMPTRPISAGSSRPSSVRLRARMRRRPAPDTPGRR